jgi:putative DNA primase/helicase
MGKWARRWNWTWTSESPSSVRRRLRAYQRHYGIKVKNFVIVKSPINLFNSAADIVAVIDLVRQIEAKTGCKCEVIIGDTLARLAAGANENSGEDMGIVVSNIDMIRAETGVHFMLIHHSGKDAAKGARGWSGLRAATDTEIEVTPDDLTKTHCLEVMKKRDLQTKGDRIGFKLESVHMGIDKWGGLITSCILLSTEAPAKAQARRTRRELTWWCAYEVVGEAEPSYVAVISESRNRRAHRPH